MQTDKYSNLVSVGEVETDREGIIDSLYKLFQIAQNVSKCINQLQQLVVDAFSCRLVAKDELGKRLVKLYHVEAIFDAPSGQYACRLQLKSNFNELLSIMKANNVFLELEVGRLALGMHSAIAIC